MVTDISHEDRSARPAVTTDAGHSSPEASAAPIRVGRRRHRLGHVTAALVFAIATVAFFWPVLQGEPYSTVPGFRSVVYPWAVGASHRYVPPQADQADLSLPWDALFQRTLRQGTVPLWDSTNFDGGYPIFANGASGVFYPLRVPLLLLMSPASVHVWLSILELFLAGVLAYLFGRALGIGWSGAVLTGLSWMFASFNVAWLHFEVVAPVLVFLPLDLLLVRRAWVQRSLSAGAAASLALGATLVSGHVLYMGITVVIAVFYGASLAIVSARRAGRLISWARVRALATEFAWPITIALLACGVAAVMLLPTVQALSDAERYPFSYGALYHYDAFIHNALLASPSALIHAFLPFSGTMTTQSLNDDMAFVGTITICLATIGLFTRRPGAGLGRTIVLVAGLGAIGGPVTWLLYHALPFMKIYRPYGRLFQWWSFGVALLGGIGLDRLLTVIRQGRQPADRQRQRRVRRRITVVVIACSSAALLVSAVQLVIAARSVSPPFRSYGQAASYSETPLISAIKGFQRGQGWPARVAFLTNGPSVEKARDFGVVYGSVSLVFGIDEAGGYDSKIPRRTVDLLRVIQGESVAAVLRRGLPGAIFTTFPSEKVRYELLARTGIAALVVPPSLANLDHVPFTRDVVKRPRYAGPSGALFALNGDPLTPRVVDQVTAVSGQRAALEAFTAPQFQYRTTVVLEHSELQRVSAPAPLRTPAPLVEHVTRRRAADTNGFTFDVRSSQPGWLVIPENWDPGWKAQVDGQSEPVLRGNFSQQVIRMSSGRHTVELRYEPSSFRTGADVSLLVTTVLVLVLLAPLLRRVVRTRRRASGPTVDAGDPQLSWDPWPPPGLA